MDGGKTGDSKLLARPLHSEAERAMGPDFFVVGAPKAGTTALDAYLRAHPEIFMADKEMHYFGSDLAWGPLRKPISWEGYMALFSESAGFRRVGETSVGYMSSSRAAAEIKRYRPDAQIVVSLRNPIEMIHSLHNDCLRVGDENITDLEEALEAESDRVAGRRIPYSCYSAWALRYRGIARYRPLLERYIEAFGRERVHVIIFDDLKADIAGTYAALLEFLGVDPDFRPEFEVLNPSRRGRIRALGSLQVQPGLKATGRWRPVRRIVRLAIPSREARRRFGDWLQRVNTVYERETPLSDDLRRRLEADLEQDVAELGALLGRDLSHWVGASG